MRRWYSLVAVLALGSIPSAAHADSTDNMVPTNNYSPFCRQIAAGDWDNATVCQTDSAAVYYYMDSSGAYALESPDRDNVTTILNREYAPTDLSIHYDSSPVFSGPGETDIVYQEGDDIPEKAAGITWCNDEVDGSAFECDQAYIRIRGFGAYTLRRSCHETGHAVGLLHGYDAYPRRDYLDPTLGCMRMPTDSISSADLGANQVQQINYQY